VLTGDKNLKPPAKPKRLFPDDAFTSTGMKDQELERLMRQIAEDASLEDASVNEIADSPALWWSVQREIRRSAPARSPWPPNVFRRWLMIGTPLAAAVLIGLAVYLGTPPEPTAQLAEVPAVNSPAGGAVTSAPGTEIATITPAPAALSVEKHAGAKLKAERSVVRTRRAVVARTGVASSLQPKASPEIKSEFIALAYARDPDSGQVVRVKVPSSMMVQLGVVATVSRPSELVDAEVLVGDDGLTRAIRFIRQ